MEFLQQVYALFSYIREKLFRCGTQYMPVSGNEIEGTGGGNVACDPDSGLRSKQESALLHIFFVSIGATEQLIANIRGRSVGNFTFIKIDSFLNADQIAIFV